MFSWSHGAESIRLQSVLDSIKTNNLRVDTALWHQGESDAVLDIYFPEKLKAYGMEIGTREYFYQKSLNTVLDKLTIYHPSVKVGVAIASVCKNEGSEDVREAQRRLIESRANTYKSTDSDRLGIDFRHDGCHFNELGEKQIAEDYYQFLNRSFN